MMMLHPRCLFEILACIIDFNFFCFKHLFFIELQISRPQRRDSFGTLTFCASGLRSRKEFVNFRLGSSESQVIRVHDGEEERVDVQLQTPKANGKVLVYRGISPRLNFCDDSRWVEAAAVVT